MLLQVEGTGEGQVERNRGTVRNLRLLSRYATARVSFAAAFDGITVRVRVILLAALVIVVLASRIAIFRVVAWGGHLLLCRRVACRWHTAPQHCAPTAWHQLATRSAGYSCTVTKIAAATRARPPYATTRTPLCRAQPWDGVFGPTLSLSPTCAARPSRRGLPRELSK